MVLGRIKSQDVYTEEKKEDKKRGGCFCYTLCSIFLCVTKRSDGSWFSRRERRLSHFETAFKVRPFISPPKLTFSAYAPLRRYIDQSESSHLIPYMPPQSQVHVQCPHEFVVLASRPSGSIRRPWQVGSNLSAAYMLDFRHVWTWVKRRPSADKRLELLIRERWCDRVFRSVNSIWGIDNNSQLQHSYGQNI